MWLGTARDLMAQLPELHGKCKDFADRTIAEERGSLLTNGATNRVYQVTIGAGGNSYRR
jgi:hypothetical protein